MRMDIRAIDIPKSTVAVGLVLWSVLAGIGTWTLMEVINGREKDATQDSRLNSLERRVDRLEERK